MPDCPWYISAHAVRRYLSLVGREDNEREFARGETELMAMAERVMVNVASGASKPREIRPGLLHYRGPRPLRLGLRVSIERRPEGDKPQLVDVTPSHEGGVGVGAGGKGRRGNERSAESLGVARSANGARGDRGHLGTAPAPVQLVELVAVSIQLTPAVLAEVRRLAEREGVVDSVWIYRAIEERMRRQHG